jgi:hypothetical protein
VVKSTEKKNERYNCDQVENGNPMGLVPNKCIDGVILHLE